jgi:hypothetical protein|uniref:Uncharacterized protein n=1 Tax=viral metagenome TaxID=1070528 RepID=A0A6C0AGQ2_9ZZZZ
MATALSVRPLGVNVNQLVIGKRYIVTRRNANGDIETFNGTFSSTNPTSNTVFSNVVGRGMISFPTEWLISSNVVVSNLPAGLNEHINSYMGGKLRRKRTIRRPRTGR